MNNTEKVMGRYIIFSFLFVYLFLSNSIAADNYFSFAGSLTDSSGAPLNSSTSIDITINLYPTDVEPEYSYSQTFTNVTLKNGLFKLQIGPVEPTILKYNRYLELVINNTPLSPRTYIEANAVALKASDTDTINGKSLDMIAQELESIAHAGISTVYTDLEETVTTIYSDIQNIESSIYSYVDTTQQELESSIYSHLDSVQQNIETTLSNIDTEFSSTTLDLQTQISQISTEQDNILTTMSNLESQFVAGFLSKNEENITSTSFVFEESGTKLLINVGALDSSLSTKVAVVSSGMPVFEINASGEVKAQAFYGDGSGLTNIPAINFKDSDVSNLQSGALANGTTPWNTKEEQITAATTGDYFRGDKTWQPLNKATVGLPSVQNIDVTTSFTQQIGHSIGTSQIKALDSNGLMLTDETNMGIIVSGGQVGIQTDIPQADLHVEGSTYTNILDTNEFYAFSAFLADNSYDPLIVKADFDPDSAPVLIATVGRSVGINTTTPYEALEVNGGIKIGAAIYNQTGTIRWNGYDLEVSNNNLDWLSLTYSANSTDTTGAIILGAESGNTATGVYSSVLGGQYNDSIHDYSTVVGGFANRSDAAYSLIAGGQQNVATGYNSVILGGDSNIAGESDAVIVGGYDNYANGLGTIILGGVNNSTDNNAENSIILGGFGNKAIGANAYVFGYNGLGYLDNSIVHSGPQFLVPGDNQVMQVLMQAGTSDATTATMTFGDNGETQLYIPGFTSWMITGNLIARGTNGESEIFPIEAFVTRDSDDPTSVNIRMGALPFEGLMGGQLLNSTGYFDVDNSAGALLLKVNGEAGEPVAWFAKLEIQSLHLSGTPPAEN
jgi:hypothetical protein